MFKKENPFHIIQKVSIISLLLLVGLWSRSFSQISNEYMTGATKDELDTLALERTQQIVKETMGIPETPVDVEKYILGPGDELNILIITPKPREYKLEVSPEGMISIPYVGSIDVKNKTLADSRRIIIDKVNKIFNASEVSVTLKTLRKFKVIVGGAVQKPNIVTATAVDRVSEVIERAGGMKFDASIRKIALYRDNGREYLPVDLLKFSRGRRKDANPTVLGGDQIIVPQKDEETKIAIYGNIPSPGEFEFNSGDSLSTLFRFGLGFFDSAELDSVEITRYYGKGETKKWFLNLSSWRDKFLTEQPLPNDMPLLPGDIVFVRKKFDWQKVYKVAIEGEVKYPGYYAIPKNLLRISDLIERAGGLTDDAAIESAFLVRKKELKARDEEMERLWRIPPSEMSENENRYFQARVREKRGYLAINFKDIFEKNSIENNIILQDEDSLYIPAKKPFINVQGRVNNPGLVGFDPKMTYLDYIDRAGGYGFRADEGETMVVKPKGEQFLAESQNYTLEPGDNILVPPLSEKSFWKILTEGLTVLVQIASIAGLVIAITK